MSKHLLPKEAKNNKKIKIDENIEEIYEETEEFIAEKKDKHKIKSGILFSMLIPALLLVAIQFCPLEGWMLKSAYAVVLLLSALECIWALLDNIQVKDYLAVNNIALLAAVLAFGLGMNIESILILLLYKLGNLIREKVEKASWEKLKEFKHVEATSAEVESSEGILAVIPEYVNIGDIVHVAAGERIPVDGVIVEGISTIDTSTVSGQSAPWAVNEGHRVFSGCRNITSPIKIRAIKTSEQSTARNIIKLSESSVEYYSRQEKLATKIQHIYSLIMLSAVLILTVTLSILNGEWISNSQNALVLLIAVCSVSTLSVIRFVYVRSIGIATQSGVFAKGCDCIESMAKAETVVFDKTGIITEGKYVITDVFPNKVTEHELLTMAATAERFSRHPVAAALRDAVGPIDIDYRSLQIEEIPGRGISAFVGEKQVYVGNAALLEEHGIKYAVPNRPGAAIHVAVDYKYWGHILITDRIRRGAFDALENLRAQGVRKMVLLTGDVLSVAKPLASKLNFDMLRAELKPSEKVSAVDFLMSNRGDSTALAFVGDGNSDEQIMSRVDVGIALGALGSDAALASADVLIMDRDIKKLPNAFKLSRFAYHVNMINFLIWFGANTLIVVLGILGILPLLVAIIGFFIMSCAMYLNTLRIK